MRPPPPSRPRFPRLLNEDDLREKVWGRPEMTGAGRERRHRVCSFPQPPPARSHGRWPGLRERGARGARVEPWAPRGLSAQASAGRARAADSHGGSNGRKTSQQQGCRQHRQRRQLALAPTGAGCRGREDGGRTSPTSGHCGRGWGALVTGPEPGRGGGAQRGWGRARGAAV